MFDAISAQGVQHAGGREKARIVRVEGTGKGWRLLGQAQESLIIKGGIVLLPLTQAALYQPEAHHVLEEADRAKYATLVGEVGGHRRLGEQVMIKLLSH